MRFSLNQLQLINQASLDVFQTSFVHSL